MVINLPNKVLERQKALQASSYPVHMKTPTNRIALRIYLVGFSVGILGSMYGITKLIKGKQ